MVSETKASANKRHRRGRRRWAGRADGDPPIVMQVGGCVGRGRVDHGRLGAYNLLPFRVGMAELVDALG